MYGHALFWHGRDAIFERGYVLIISTKREPLNNSGSLFYKLMVGGELTVRWHVTAESGAGKHVYRCLAS